MTAMLGRIEAYGERTCGCCYCGHGKRSLKRIERRAWRRDWNVR
jgi:hypothetical protein